MVKTFVESLSAITKGTVDFLPPGLILSLSSAFLDEGKWMSTYRSEFLGSIVMIACTFSAGKWIGTDNVNVAWISHYFGVLAADFLCGGPQVNPGVTLSMWALGKDTYTSAYIKIAAQMGGGLVAFPLFHAVSVAMEWEPFGGPEFNMDEAEDHPVEAFLSEAVATFLLLLLIYLLNWELNFGRFHYIIKQSLTAIGIRALIEYFPTAGPAMNPMLATTWAVFGVGSQFEFPDEVEHYFVYWLGPAVAAVLASLVYAAYAGEPLFGTKLPIGPFKPSAAPEKKPEEKPAKKDEAAKKKD